MFSMTIKAFVLYDSAYDSINLLSTIEFIVRTRSNHFLILPNVYFSKAYLLPCTFALGNGSPVRATYQNYLTCKFIWFLV